MKHRTAFYASPTPIAPLPQHLAFALTEPTFGKKAQGQDAGLGMGVANHSGEASFVHFRLLAVFLRLNSISSGTNIPPEIINFIPSSMVMLVSTMSLSGR